MKAVVVKSPNAPLSVTELVQPEPKAQEVRIKVRACGICHSDQFVAKGLWPNLALPRVPGHEIAGIVDKVGAGVTQFKPGDRVGLGWHGGHDGTCKACLQGKLIHCGQRMITGISFDGGYAEYVVAPAVALARMPEGMDFAEAAPLLCAGVTTYNALRHSLARPGDLVAIQSMGGLGHLGVQFARAMGFEVVAISRGTDKRKLAMDLGAHHYLDTTASNVGTTLTQLGGAKVILATGPNANAISALVPGLGLEGEMIVVAAPFEPLAVSALDLISRGASVRGWPSGTGQDSTETMAFAKLHNIRTMIETFPLEQAQKAYDRMCSGEVRFRSVLVHP